MQWRPQHLLSVVRWRGLQRERRREKDDFRGWCEALRQQVNQTDMIPSEICRFYFGDWQPKSEGIDVSGAFPPNKRKLGSPQTFLALWHFPSISLWVVGCIACANGERGHVWHRCRDSGARPTGGVGGDRRMSELKKCCFKRITPTWNGHTVSPQVRSNTIYVNE